MWRITLGLSVDKKKAEIIKIKENYYCSEFYSD